jgi:hypothetical protein
MNFPDIFVEPSAPSAVSGRSRVELLLKSQRGRSLCPNGTTDALQKHYRTPKERPMNKLLSTVGLAIGIALVSMLAGCQLYFGDHNNRNDRPGQGSGSPPGYACSGDAQCAAGCFCADGTCAEGGFCSKDPDCGDGFKCDTGRSSCVPIAGCTANEQCNPGSRCDSTKGCVATCKCTSDADAVRQGAAWCDEARSTCMPGTDPAGVCTGAVTCNTAAPQCAAGEVPLVKDGCYTGACRAIKVCEAAPVCTAFQHEADCLARTADCASVYTGHDCTKPNGDACHAGDVDCKCKTFTFAACALKVNGVGRIELTE